MIQCVSRWPSETQPEPAISRPRDDPRHRRPGRRLDRDRLARPQRPARRRARHPRDRAAGRARARLHARTAAPAGLSSGRTGMIGLTLPLVADAYFGPMLSGAAEALYESDMRIVLAPTLHEHDREVSLLERLMRGTTDGAILMLPEESVDELRTLQRQGFPFVVVDPREPPPDGIAVRRRDARVGREAGDGASARARPPPDRRDRRRARLVRDRGAPAGFRAALAGRRDPARPRAHRLLRLAHPARHRGGTATALAARPADRDLRVQRQRRDRRAACRP